jgi:hypothetical protein
VTPDFDPWALLKNAWVALAGVFIWIFKRHLNEDDTRAGNVRNDIEKLHQKIDENHRQVMNVLLARRD